MKGSQIEHGHLRLGDLELLLTLGTTASFTQTAQRLGLARSTVSRRVAEIEGSLGVALFQRNTRKVRPSPAGIRFLQGARRSLDAAHEALEALAPEAALRGTLRVSAPPVLGTLVMVPAVLSLLERYPGARVVFDTSARFLDLELERVDVALRLGDAGHVAAGEHLGHVQHRWVCLPGHPAAGVTQPEQLDPAWLLGPDEVMELTRGGALHRVRPAGRLSAAEPDILLRAVHQGLGAARLPHPMVGEALAQGRLGPVLPDWHAGLSEVRLLQRRRLHPLVIALVEAVRAQPAWGVLLGGSQGPGIPGPKRG